MAPNGEGALLPRSCCVQPPTQCVSSSVCCAGVFETASHQTNLKASSCAAVLLAIRRAWRSSLRCDVGDALEQVSLANQISTANLDHNKHRGVGAQPRPKFRANVRENADLCETLCETQRNLWGVLVKRTIVGPPLDVLGAFSVRPSICLSAFVCGAKPRGNRGGTAGEPRGNRGGTAGEQWGNRGNLGGTLGEPWGEPVGTLGEPRGNRGGTVG